jgi:crotonobetainyl-CoA:carnitine CoA-transferase CaiB-like acyl-CoA transferase
VSAPLEDRARPLRGICVVTLADHWMPSLAKTFADLGADVEVLRHRRFATSGRPLLDLIGARGKRFTELDEAGERAVIEERLRSADVLICSPGANGVKGMDDVEALAQAFPHLVVAVVTDFGVDGGRQEWLGSEAVYNALAGTLSRSGEPGRPPFLPPGELFMRGAAQQIAWGILVALVRAMDGPVRRGAVLDCSIFECGIVCLDPAFGMTGSGTPDSVEMVGRPDAGSVYPVFEVRDGYVRVCVLAKGQWASLLEWMGNPPELLGDDLLTNPGRHAKAHLVVPAMAAFFARMTTDELVRQCRERRIPASKVLSVADVLEEEHYRQAGVLTQLTTENGQAIVTAEGMARINGIRTVPRTTEVAADAWPTSSATAAPEGSGPFHGITVLDLGVIIAGAEASVVFAQQGARVIRVENKNFPDGLRRSFDHLSPALARGHLGKENVGLDLRSDEGREIFKELARRADIVVSNFKPGTLERLGISYEELAAVNPGIICVESTAFGDSGPWRTAMGYGPLVRAGSGLSWLWRHDAEGTYFADGITVYPDHLVGRICSIAAAACLLDRRRTGVGAHVTVAQSDIALVQLGELLAADSLRPGSVQPPGRPAPSLLRTVILPAAGVEQWCVVDPRTPEQMGLLRSFLELGAEDDVDTAVAAFVASRDPHTAAAALQAKGIPAAPMLRPHETADDEGLRQRRMHFTTPVAGTDQEVLVERYPVLSSSYRTPQPSPAANFGAHTRTVLAELGRTPEEVDRLLSEGIAQEAAVFASSEH